MEAATISIDEELKDCIAQLDALQKKSILELIKSFVKRDEEMQPQTIEEYNKELEDAETEYERGEFITHEAMLNQMKKW